MGAEAAVAHVTGEACRGLQRRRRPEERPESHAASWPPEGTDPANTSILAFQPRELGHDTFTVFVPHGLWYFVMAALGT